MTDELNSCYYLFW